MTELFNTNMIQTEQAEHNRTFKTQISPMTISERKAFVEGVIEGINEGTIHPIRLAVYLKSLEDILKAVKEHYNVKEAIRDAADLYPEKTFGAFGAEITKTGRTTYNFAVCNDPVLDQLIDEQTRLKAMIEARQEMLKTGVNPETGETFTKPVPITNSFLTIKLR